MIRSRFLAAFLFCALGTLTLSSFSFLQRADTAHDLVFHHMNFHDGLWHIALTEAVAKKIPPENPVLAGQQLVGYHYIYDVLVSRISQLTGLSVLFLYLRVMPVLLAFCFSFSTLVLFLRTFPSRRVAYCGAAIAVLGSSLAYVVPIFSPLSKADQSAFWLDQPIHLGINQQLLLSLIMLNALLLLLFTVKQRRSWHVIVCALLLGLMVAVKIYGALLLFPALFLVGVVDAIRNRKAQYLWVVLLALCVGVPLVLMLGNRNGFPFLFQPGWFFKTMFESGDRLNLPRWELMRLAAEQRHDVFRLALLWVSAAVIFFVGNFGAKIVGLFGVPAILKKEWQQHQLFYTLLTIITAGAFFVPTFFLQKGVSWNTIQFLPYAFVPLALLTTKTITNVCKTLLKQCVVLLLIFVSLLPSTFITFVTDLRPASLMHLPVQDVQTLLSLQHTYLEKELLVGFSMNGTSVVPALSKRSVYWSDEGVSIVINDRRNERPAYIRQIEESVTNCNSDQILIEHVNGITQLLTCPLATPPRGPVCLN